MALIYDMSVLNEYVHQASFKLEGWEEMFEYAKSAKCGVEKILIWNKYCGRTPEVFWFYV